MMLYEHTTIPYKERSRAYLGKAGYSDRNTIIIIPESMLENSVLYKKYEVLKNNWLRETAHHSNPDYKFNNINYKEIKRMGKSVLPYLFDDLFNLRADFFDAIADILGVDPIKIENYGNVELMIKDWKVWRLQNKI